jgi:ribose transport system permease protein
MTSSPQKLLQSLNPFRPSAGVQLQTLSALIAIVVLAVVTSPRAFDGSVIFLQLGNLTDILRQVSLIGILSTAMTFVIMTAGIDLGVGSVLALSSTITAMVLTRTWQNGPVGASIASAIAIAVGVCALTGTLNGVLVANLRIQPFIVTLASMIGIRGLAKWLTSNENIDIGFGQDLASRFAIIFRQKWIVIASYAVLAGAFGILLAKTVFGRYVRAVGDNERAALYTGLPVKRTKVWVYTISGALAGFAGVLYAAENHQGNPNAGVAYELDAIAAAVIGGTRLAGGTGSIFGTVLGTLIMGVLTNMLRLNNVDSNVEMMIKAVIILLAVVLQRDLRRV